MREIKFQAWDGYVMHSDVWIVSGLPYSSKSGYYEVFSDREIEGGILRQFTGLKDKSGKEIYEGDIIQTWDGKSGIISTDGRPARWEVVFNDGAFVLRGMNYPYDWTQYAEVIGNIYENPNLLEKKGKD